MSVYRVLVSGLVKTYSASPAWSLNSNRAFRTIGSIGTERFRLVFVSVKLIPLRSKSTLTNEASAAPLAEVLNRVLRDGVFRRHFGLFSCLTLESVPHGRLGRTRSTGPYVSLIQVHPAGNLYSPGFLGHDAGSITSQRRSIEMLASPPPGE